MRKHGHIAAALACALLLAACATQGQGGTETRTEPSEKEAAASHAANDLYYHRSDIAAYLSGTFGEKLRRTEFDISTEDMTFTIRENQLQSIILGEWNEQYQFHGLKVGDKLRTAQSKLEGDFSASRQAQAADGLAVYSDRNDGDYFLELDFDDDGTIYLIKYAHRSLDR